MTTTRIRPSDVYADAYVQVDETCTDCTEGAELCETCMHDHEAECRRCADPGE